LISHIKNGYLKKIQVTVFYIYKPHFNWAPQLVQVLHPPMSAICPSRHTGQRSPTSEPMVTFVFSSSCIVSTNTTFGVSYIVLLHPLHQSLVVPLLMSILENHDFHQHTLYHLLLHLYISVDKHSLLVKQYNL